MSVINYDETLIKQVIGLAISHYDS